ncbi:hypothetical protein B0H14DRAFT_3445100 [Mycena olivaceomarginata]|nr:hypothetical protein B0H14DRAFT_3445100 [Mycena olivaceomarginata]
MPPVLLPTNMTIDEMIPDHTNPGHDPRFWCLPPVRDKPNGTPGNYPMYLVSQGRQVGVWHNWTVVKAMVTRHPSGAQRGHKTMVGCVAEWQEHCLLGVHPHPAEPKRLPTPATNTTTPVSPFAAIKTIPGPPRSRGRHVDPGLQAELQQFCMPNLSLLSLETKSGEDADDSVLSRRSNSVSLSLSSVTASTWADVPVIVRYFALWGGRVVYTDRAQAKVAFLAAEAEGARPQILSTSDYDEAQAFSESVYWCD